MQRGIYQAQSVQGWVLGEARVCEPGDVHDRVGDDAHKGWATAFSPVFIAVYRDSRAATPSAYGTPLGSRMAWGCSSNTS
jgi:hypothetical protein